MCGLTDNSKCETFKNGNVVKFKNGPEMFYLWGDKVELEYFIVLYPEADNPDSVRVYNHPYFLTLSANDLELVAVDEFEDFPDDFVEGWTRWDSLEDTDDYTGPNFIEYLGR